MNQSYKLMHKFFRRGLLLSLLLGVLTVIVLFIAYAKLESFWEATLFSLFVIGFLLSQVYYHNIGNMMIIHRQMVNQETRKLAEMTELAKSIALHMDRESFRYFVGSIMDSLLNHLSRNFPEDFIEVACAKNLSFMEIFREEILKKIEDNQSQRRNILDSDYDSEEILSVSIIFDEGSALSRMLKEVEDLLKKQHRLVSMVTQEEILMGNIQN